MPELVEGIAHFLTTLWALALYGYGPWPVLALWADFTKPEAKAARLTTGLVQRLHNRSTMQRGTNKRQTPLLAKELIRTPDNLTPMPITSLTLRGVHHSVRALIVDMGGLWLRLAYLTHTSVQVYPRAQWEVILQIPKKRRGFSVGLAIECPEFILAFVSLDQLFQPTWSTTHSGLGAELPYIYPAFTEFIERLANWIRSRWHLDRMDLAVHSIRDANKIWVGVGAYTVNELFFLAGIPIGIRERDLFGNPSRTARLVDAFWVLAHVAEKELPDLIRPSWKKGVLVPDRRQRRSYPNKMLHIYGKDKIFVPSRLAGFVNEHTTTVAKLTELGDREDMTWFLSEWDEFLPDPYEPAYVRAAYEASSTMKHQFGHLIWGEAQWAVIQGFFRFPKPAKDDPLTKVFKDFGCDMTKTYLRFDSLGADPSNLFSNLKDLTDRRAVYPFALSTSKKGILWSLINKYPDNSMADASNTFRATIYEEDPQQHVFSKKSSENGVAVGPLEYCANGRVFRSGNRVLVLPVRGYLNPDLSESDVKKMVIRDWRKEFEEREQAKLRKEAERQGRDVRQAELNSVSHRALTEGEKRQRDRKVEAALKEVRLAFGDRTNSCVGSKRPCEDSSGKPNVKRRRRDDAVIIAGGKENVIPQVAEVSGRRRSGRVRQ